MEQWIEDVLELLEQRDRESSEGDRVAVQLEEISNKLTRLENKIDEQTILSAKTGVRHLVDAITSDVPEVKNSEFQMARAIFSQLASLEPAGVTEGTSGQMPNLYLITLGYWGNFNYFNLRNDRRNAAIQLYECTLRFPVQGLIIFGDSFFSQPYGALISDAAGRLAAVQRQYEELETDNFWKNTWYLTKKGLAFVVAGAAGLSAGAIAAALTGGSTSPVGLVAARGVLNSLEVHTPTLRDTADLKAEIEKWHEKLELHFDELLDECDERLDTLRKFADVFALSAAAMKSLSEKTSGASEEGGVGYRKALTYRIRSLAAALKGSDQIYLGSEIPEAKLANIRSHFPVPEAERIFLFCDDAVSQSCKCGLLIGRNGVYWKNGWLSGGTSGSLQWNDLKDKAIALDDSTLCLGEARVSLVCIGENRKRVRDMLVQLKEFVRSQGAQK